MSLFSKFFNLTEDRKVDYFVKDDGKKKQMFFTDPNDKKVKPASDKMDESSFEKFLSALIKGVENWQKNSK